jgi:hypothetical protein
MAQEVVKTYYRCSADRTDAFSTRNPEDIANLLHNDTFKTGVRPAEHLRAMNINFMQPDFQSVDPDEPRKSQLEKPSNQLFEGVVKKKGFRLHVTVFQSKKSTSNNWTRHCVFSSRSITLFELRGLKSNVSWAFSFGDTQSSFAL